jgi:hypothetical protein
MYCLGDSERNLKLGRRMDERTSRGSRLGRCCGHYLLQGSFNNYLIKLSTIIMAHRKQVTDDDCHRPVLPWPLA